MLLLKDIYPEGPGDDFQTRLREHLLPVGSVGEDTPVAQLLRRFRLGAPHLAVVEDLDARVVGFVTMEDVLEAVFGEITDEHEKERANQINREPQRLDDGSVLVRGDTPLFKLERELGETIAESETLSTVTGLLMERLGQMPTVGSSIAIGEHTATVMKMRGAQVESVRVVLPPTALG